MQFGYLDATPWEGVMQNQRSELINPLKVAEYLYSGWGTSAHEFPSQLESQGDMPPVRSRAPPHEKEWAHQVRLSFKYSFDDQN
jgi:hypothetical protein